MTKLRLALLACSLAATAASAQEGKNDPKGGKPPPTDTECIKLPAPKTPFAFGPGEELEYDVDAMGAQAAKLYLKALPAKNGVWPISVEAKTNTLFAKVRRVSGGGMTYLSPKDLHPVRYTEDTMENDVRRTADVQFTPKDKNVHVEWVNGDKKGKSDFKYANDGLDLLGAVYLMRQLPLAEKQKLCFDVYGIRRLWRVDARVEAKEHVSLPVGEFEAYHLAGLATRLDNKTFRRELHIWISDDAKRLPLVAVGVIDIGAVRATLSSIKRPGEKSTRAEGKENLKW